MRVLKAKINFHEQYSNPCELEILVDRIPKNDELVFEQKGNMYFAEKDGYVNFYYYDKPSQGYGGRTFNIKVHSDDGIINKELHGPWSSRAGVMNVYFTQCIEVTMTDDPEAFERGYTCIAGAITLNLALKAICKIRGRGWSFLRSESKTDIVYNLVKISGGTEKVYKNCGVHND